MSRMTDLCPGKIGGNQKNSNMPRRTAANPLEKCVNSSQHYSTQLTPIMHLRLPQPAASFWWLVLSV